jgi:polyisoprenoid-binding protein YceI
VLLRLLESSHASVDVRSKGILGALEHELTFTGTPRLRRPLDVTPGVAGNVELEVDATLPIANLAAPTSASSGDRERMLENLRGRDVLDALRHPDLSFRGHYKGGLERGVLEGQLFVRGSPHPVRFDVVVAKGASGVAHTARATWEGTQTSLGIKPFKAMLGALRLHDWIRIRIEASFATDV